VIALVYSVYVSNFLEGGSAQCVPVSVRSKKSVKNEEGWAVIPVGPVKQIHMHLHRTGDAGQRLVVRIDGSTVPHVQPSPPVGGLLQVSTVLRWSRISLVVLVALLATAPTGPGASAQSQRHTVPSRTPWERADSSGKTDHPRLPTSWHRLSAWVGGSSLNGQLIGEVPNSSIGLIGLRYHHRLAPRPETASTGVTYTYFADVMPLVILSIPSGTIPRTAGSGELVDTEGTTAYGIGVSPVGLRIGYQTGARIEPFISGSTGGVFFVDPLPDDRGKHFNFTVDAGAGVRLALTQTTALSVAYRYHHLSNGFRGEINPGIDSHLFQLGFTIIP